MRRMVQYVRVVSSGKQGTKVSLAKTELKKKETWSISSHSGGLRRGRDLVSRPSLI